MTCGYGRRSRSRQCAILKEGIDCGFGDGSCREGDATETGECLESLCQSQLVCPTHSNDLVVLTEREREREGGRERERERGGGKKERERKREREIERER